jgi:hypothetical protein
MPSPEASQRFPFINLEKAVSRAEALYKANERGTEMAVPTAFTVWEYSEKSSGGFQTVAALKMYGLLIDSSTGDGRKVRLSDDGLRFFRDERDEERTKLVRQFALLPPIIKDLWKVWSANPPSDTVARSYLKLERKLNDQSARALLGIYKDNLAYAGLTSDDTIPMGPGEIHGNVPPVPVNIGQFVQWTSNGVDQFKFPQKVVWISDDRRFLRVHGSPTGISMEEVTITNPPAPPMAGAAPVDSPPSSAGSSDINVYLTGKRIQITADIDADGIKKLKEMLGKYEDILALLN